MYSETAEHKRIEEQNSGEALWNLWGPYLSERQWSTVREDYDLLKNAWEYFPHDHARSRAYRWGEDGLAGFCDHKQRLCLGLALWNGRDAILKERLFGLTNKEGNHGEDVKELYYYLDATPSYAYARYLYKYPHAAYPYDELLSVNRQRGRSEAEYELLDTGVFEGNRYFDVYVDYAKADVRDVLVCITIHNRGPESAALHVLPQLWLRNTWSWGEAGERPSMQVLAPGQAHIKHAELGDYCWYADELPPLLACDNETNVGRMYGSSQQGYFKDAFHDYVVHGRKEAVNPTGQGSKIAAHYVLEVPAGGERRLRLRLSHEGRAQPFADFEAILQQRKQEADAYYAAIQAPLVDADVALIQRQALAGLLWSKQYYRYDVAEWIKGDPGQPSPDPVRKQEAQAKWTHLNAAEVLLMPDKWEYPWFASWDLAFQCISHALVDIEFAKDQLILLTREWYMHPSGQLPAYEWAFGDANPPIHAWAAWEIFSMERKKLGDTGDLVFLERVFHKLMLNFTWWVNREDPDGLDIFQGGFLGLDNIGVFDRSRPEESGGYINQADGTAWVAMYSLNLMRIALELALHNPAYEDIASKFFEHFLRIAAAMNDIGGEGIDLWDEQDKFFYDVLSLPSGEKHMLKARSLVGFIPLLAVEVLDAEILERLPNFQSRMRWLLNDRPDLACLVSHWEVPGHGERRLLSLLRGSRMKNLLQRMLDESEFLSDHGIRSLSAQYRDTPYVFQSAGKSVAVSYWPAESECGMFGGNSNWRGPVWFPVNYLLIRSLQRFHDYYGAELTVECPSGSGVMMNLREVSNELSRRLIRIFQRDENGLRPLFGGNQTLQNDPHFKDLLFFHEYFHGDNGAGIGASHQTGWTALLANLIQQQCQQNPNTA